MLSFYSSISEHTRYALVTGVQTCARPIPRNRPLRGATKSSSAIFLPTGQCLKDENLVIGAQSIAESVAVDDHRRVHEHVHMAPEAPLVVDDVGAQQRLPREDTRQHFAHKIGSAPGRERVCQSE